MHKSFRCTQDSRLLMLMTWNTRNVSVVLSTFNYCDFQAMILFVGVLTGHVGHHGHRLINAVMSEAID